MLEKHQENHKYENKINELEKDMVSVKHILNSQGDILRELKELVATQTQTLSSVVLLQNAQKDQSDKIKDQNDRLKTIENKMEDGSRSSSKIDGGIKVFIFMFAIIQGMAVWYFNKIDRTVDNTIDLVTITQKKQIEIEQKIINLEKQKINTP